MHKIGQNPNSRIGTQKLNQYNSNKKIPNDKVFIEHCSLARHHVKKRIIDQKLISYSCSICGIGPEWNNKPMPLILDHINGINDDNRLENLRFICSNCDSQLPTYKSRNILWKANPIDGDGD